MSFHYNCNASLCFPLGHLLSLLHRMCVLFVWSIMILCLTVLLVLTILLLFVVVIVILALCRSHSFVIFRSCLLLFLLWMHVAVHVVDSCSYHLLLFVCLFLSIYISVYCLNFLFDMWITCVCLRLLYIRLLFVLILSFYSLSCCALSLMVVWKYNCLYSYSWR
jgi:hypothetical protein